MMNYDMTADAIATAIWEISTGNGRDLPEHLWDDHAQNCNDAVANTHIEGISIEEWQAAALKRIGHSTTT